MFVVFVLLLLFVVDVGVVGVVDCRCWTTATVRNDSFAAGQRTTTAAVAQNSTAATAMAADVAVKTAATAAATATAAVHRCGNIYHCRSYCTNIAAQQQPLLLQLLHKYYCINTETPLQ